jgi:D-beta-D-heptose 7-phosphate kinase/D-beta-D-heptose 1-phosphate adenosyltransferase
LDRFEEILSGIADSRLLVVGDVVLDEYLDGVVERISPEAPVPVVHIERESVVLGGAGNVVRNLVELGAECAFCTVVGADADGECVRDLLRELDVSTDGVVSDPARRTTRKSRVVARSQQVLRFDRESEEPLAAEPADQLLSAVQMARGSVSGVICEDYGKGVFAPAFTRRLLSDLAGAGLRVAVDPKQSFEAFRGAALVKPNLREAERATGFRASGSGGIDKIAVGLRKLLGDCALVITRGVEGMTIFDGGEPGRDVGTVERQVFDVQGAGDTTIAVLALAQHAGASLYEAAILANAAASVVVGKVGTATVTRDELREQLPATIGALEETQ